MALILDNKILFTGIAAIGALFIGGLLLSVETSLLQVAVAMVEVFVIILLARSTAIYARDTTMIANNTKKDIEQTGRIIEASDSNEVIAFCEKRLEKIYSPLFHGPSWLLETIFLRKDRSKGARDTIQYEQQLRNQVDQYLFLATGDFQRAWKEFLEKDLLDDESLTRLKSIIESDYHMYEKELGAGIRQRHPGLEEELSLRRVFDG